MTRGAGPSSVIHATTVALGDAGILILGASGSGKSSLALQLIALGAVLVADDQTRLVATDAGLIATAPPDLVGLIEARGIGILLVPAVAAVRIALAVDLDQTQTQRHPPRHHLTLHGIEIDLVFGPISAHFPASLMCYVAGGRLD